MTDPARTLDAPVILIDHQEKTPWAPFVIIKGESWLLPTERAHLYGLGFSTLSIAVLWGCDHSTVNAGLRAIGVDLRSCGGKARVK